MQIEIGVKDIKRLELAEITPEFLNDLGFENEKELREALREQMIERIDYDIAQAQREQVSKYLLDNTFFELPARLSHKQVDRVMQRKMIDLLMRGVPQEQVEKHLEPLRVGVRDEALRTLEQDRHAKIIGKGLEAQLTIKASAPRLALLKRYEEGLKEFLNVSSVVVVESREPDITASPAPGQKCARCWNFMPDTADYGIWQNVCGRCRAAGISGRAERRGRGRGTQKRSRAGACRPARQRRRRPRL